MILAFISMILLLPATSSAQSSTTAVNSSVSAPLSCPTTMTEDSLEQFRKQAIAKVTSGDYGSVKTKLKDCFRPNLPSCLTELQYYVNYKSESSGVQFGSPPVEGLTLKSEKDLPSEFLVKGADGRPIPGAVNLPPDILNLAKRKGWKAIAYKTRSTGGFDSAPNLTLVAIPGADKDIYLQISPPPEPGARTNNDPYPHPLAGHSVGQETLTVISVDKTKNPPVAQLRLIKKAGSTSYRWNDRLESQSCTQCHTTPLRSISPIGYLVTNGNERRLKPEDEKTITEINEMMVIDRLSWGSVKTASGTIIHKGAPPDSQPVGWSPPRSETRKEEFLKNCATESRSYTYTGFGGYTFTASMPAQPNINYPKIAEAMDCVQCHNGSIRGNLHSNFSASEIAFKIMVDRSMPPGADLNQEERLALFNCLKAEKTNTNVIDKWKTRAEWLKKEVCETPASTGPSENRNINRTGVQ